MSTERAVGISISAVKKSRRRGLSLGDVVRLGDSILAEHSLVSRDNNRSAFFYVGPYNIYEISMHERLLNSEYTGWDPTENYLILKRRE